MIVPLLVLLLLHRTADSGSALRLQAFLDRYQGHDGEYGFPGGAVALKQHPPEDPLGVSTAKAATGCAACRNGGPLRAANIAAKSEAADDTPMTTTTPMQFASNTKVFTAAMILRLSDEGAVQLDDGVDRYLDSATASAVACRSSAFPTVRNLLRMQSGWPGINDDEALDVPRCRSREPWSRADLATLMAKARGASRGGDQQHWWLSGGAWRQLRL